VFTDEVLHFVVVSGYADVELELVCDLLRVSLLYHLVTRCTDASLVHAVSVCVVSVVLEQAVWPPGSADAVCPRRLQP